MRIIKNIRLFSLVLAILFANGLFAQKGHKGHRKMRGMDVEMLKEEVNLTEDQASKIEAIQGKYEARFKALKEQEGDRTEKMEEMKVLRKALKEEVGNVLTEEQKAQLKAKREAQRKERKERFESIDHEALKSEMKAYREENVQPVMLAQRQKLEAELSAEDKATIAELRTELEGLKKKHKKRFEGQKGHPHHGKKFEEGQKEERTRPDMEEHKASFEKLHSLVDKYEEPIAALLEEIAPQREQWKADMKAIKKKYVPEREGEKTERKERLHRGEHSKKHGHKKGGQRKKGAFLLMNPNEVTEASETNSLRALTEVTIFPNPATTQNTIRYEVIEAGQVRIELHNEAGNTLKVVVDAYKEVGEYTAEVDLSTIKDGLYYYSISDQRGVSTKTVVVSKQ